MFERYTEKARRVIFFARYEASQFGCSCIETEHLVLGVRREGKALANQFLASEAVRHAITQRRRTGLKANKASLWNWCGSRRSNPRPRLRRVNLSP